MNAAEMPTTQDSAIVEAFGRPMDVLYTQVETGEALPALVRVLELRSWLAMVEDQAVQTRQRIHEARAKAVDLYGTSADDLRFDVAVLEATQRVGLRYAETLGELLQNAPATSPTARRPVSFTHATAHAVATADGALTVRPVRTSERVTEVGAGRHRR
ncbi:hypothetical protein [Actinacidiphila rubida]|uniref:Uncharacterized protein n=1 Tax=Actinacidiphila rubida TaxID=310780 RepID=A0A1H8S5P9_9ACTN|nr:hypothetical protein [Actinacidiphila rubida]SEO73866.1 hypothetical protein SAMN05216267_103959 [Actinacidiphila rubida]